METPIELPPAETSDGPNESRSQKEIEFSHRLSAEIASWVDALGGAQVGEGRRIDYALYEFGYGPLTNVTRQKRGQFQTDIMIYDESGPDAWIPRVVIECKYASTSTHDLLAYSAKAAAHRTFHPYLRYGFVIGDCKQDLSFKILRHGREFDFLAALPPGKSKAAELLMGVIASELRASRHLSKIYQNQKLPPASRVVHHRLEIGSEPKSG